MAKTARLKVNGGLIEINTTSGDFGVFLAADKNVGGTTKNLAIYDRNAWNKVLHSGNYTDYTVPKTGGTFSGNVTAPTFIGNLTGNASNALALKGISAGFANGRAWIPIVESSGVMEIGKYIDFHTLDEGDGVDYSLRIECQGAYRNRVYFPTTTGTLALTSDIPTNYLQKSNADWYGILFNSTSEGGGVRMALQNTGVLKSGFGSNNDSTYIVDYVSGSNIHLNTKLEFEYDGKRNEVLHGGNYTNFNGRKLQTLRVDGDYWYPDNYFLYGQWASDNGSILDWKVDNYAVRVDIAKKLATPRTIWGQSFDGTGNVDGDMTIYDGSITIKGRGGNASTKEILFVSSDYYNGVKVVAEHANWASRKDLVIYTSNNEVAPYEPKWAEAIRVGYKNDVTLAATKIRVSTPAISSLDATNGSANAWNVNYNAMFESNNNALTITVDGTQNVRHAMIQVGHSNGGFAGALGDLYINPLGGDVGIGTTNPTSKLHVAGGARITDSTTIEQNLFVDKNIYIAESSSDGGIYFGDDEYAYIKETPDDVMTIASNQGLILRVNHISDEGAVIRMEGPVRIGDAILDWDAANKCITIKNVNTGQKASLFVDGGITGTKIH